MSEHTTTALEPRLSVIMPVYNEEATVLSSIRRVLDQDFVREIVVVNDGSSDDTAERLASLDDPRVTVVTHEVNQGKGAGIRSAVAVVIGPYVAIQDADLEYDPRDLAKLLQPLDAGHADVVYGSRFLNSDARRVLFFWHSVGNRLLTLASNMATNINLSDMETCYKVFRIEFLKGVTIEEDRFGFEPEITVKMARAGARIYEVGISYAGRSYSEGKKIGWKDGVSAFRCIAKYSIKERRHGRRS
jgi:glycosyltransferase involved in cell wall biosynthesis